MVMIDGLDLDRTGVVHRGHTQPSAFVKPLLYARPYVWLRLGENCYILCHKKIRTGFAEKKNLIWKIRRSGKIELNNFSVQPPMVWNVLSTFYMGGSLFLFRSSSDVTSSERPSLTSVYPRYPTIWAHSTSVLILFSMCHTN